MTIKVGDALPEANFRVMTAEGPQVRTTKDIFAGKTMILFGVPGAFTPTCHKNHLPGYLARFEELTARGVDGIAVTGVNDVFVMNAWAEATGGKGKIEYLADGNGDFVNAIGLSLDASGGGLGLRSKRYSMLVRDGIVDKLAIEDAPGKADQSGAEAMLEML